MRLVYFVHTLKRLWRNAFNCSSLTRMQEITSGGFRSNQDNTILTENVRDEYGRRNKSTA